MNGPLQGVKVVELGIWVAVPSASVILADWGADVIKIEQPGGDPLRAASAASLGPAATADPHFGPDNRGKRSVALDLRSEEGLASMLALLDSADVFVTNVRVAGLARLGLDPETVRSRNPRLVYALVTAYGLAGPDADSGGFDLGAYWSRGGVAGLMTPPGQDPPIQRNGMGDHLAGMTTAAMINAALVGRGRTGEGQLVSTSLLRVAAFHVSTDFNMKLMLDIDPDPRTRQTAENPLWNNYNAGDGRRFWLINPDPTRAWPLLATVLDRTEWLDDPRYATQQARKENCRALIAELDEIFVGGDYAGWVKVFAAEPNILYAPINTVDDALADPQTAAAGAFVDVRKRYGVERQIATPVDFHGTPGPVPVGAPQVGEHTDRVLAALADAPGAWPVWDDR